MVFLNKFKVFLGIFIPFLAFFLMSQNTFALYTSEYGVRVLSWDNNVCGNPIYSEQHYYNQYFSGCGVSTIVPISSSVTATGDTVVYSGKMNIVKQLNSFNSNDWKPYPNIGIRSVYFSENQLVLQQPPVINYWITHWSDNVNGVNVNFSTLTIQWSFIATGNINNTSGNIRISLYNDQSNDLFDLPGSTNQTNYYYFEPTSDDVQVVFTDNGSSYYNQMISQNQTIISQNKQLLDGQKQNSQDIIDNQNQNTQDIIRSNQKCRSSRNLIQTMNWQTNNVTKTEDGDIVKLTANSGTLARAVFGLPFLEQGKTYTLSFYSKGVSTAGSLTYARIREYSNSGIWLTPQSIIPVSSDFVRVSVTFTANNVSSPFAWLYLSSSTSSTNDIEIYVKDFQLEEGSSATEYIPFGEEVCKNINEDYYDEQRQADQNISDQTSSGIQGAENQQTTNLIGVLSNFLTQLQSFSATDCNLSLPFPSFIGGTRIVNICQGKDVLGNFITIIGTLAMVGFYIPLAMVLLKMIYNEIRSFTNG